jgi:alcohol dehydrogenase
MTMPTEFTVPTRIVFGRGRLAELGTFTRQYGTRALLVSGRSAMRSNGTLARAEHFLAAAGVKCDTFAEISPNPRSDEADEGVAQARRSGTEVVVGLGGGSALDAAKAIACGISFAGVGPLVGTTLPDHTAALPIIAVPTTAGSGSEVTRGATLTDVQRRLKSGIRGDCLFPKIALVDPELTASLPRHTALISGFDALAHSIEGYLARNGGPVNDVLAERAMRLLGENLPRLARGEQSKQTQDQLSLAALLGGMNVATASTCLPHRLQQAMGSLSQVSHGQGLATIYPAWLRAAAPFTRGKLTTVAGLLGMADGADGIAEFITGIGIARTMGQLGFSTADLPLLVGKVTGDLRNDPIEQIGPDLMHAIYERSF